MENNIESMLEEESLNFIEPDFSSLINHGEPGVIITEAKKDITASKILIDENENPLIFAVRCGDVWSASSWLYREPTREEIGIFDDVSGDLYQEKRSDIEKALRDYFSRRLINEVSPASEDLTDSRADIVRDLFEELLGKNISGSCIDACCGSGVGSMILRDMGGYVYAYDNDPALLSSGFASGRLNLE
ncbi:MAG TPA: hypothetical protein O0W90_02265, partial [Methanocorpusculum sp.]|nr:hypothetical protein [Methanocorpusculum sp.]